MKLAFIGIGKVGYALANQLQKKGHDIMIAHDDPQSHSVQKALSGNSSFKLLPVQEAIDTADMILLATPFQAAEEILMPLRFYGKTLIDCTNPVGKGITHGLHSQISGAEKIKIWAGDAKVVKAYTIYGYENLENSSFPAYAVKPAMLIAGDDPKSKEQVRLLNDDLGFETVDTGGLEQSLHLEHMTLLWVKMVRANGHHPHFTWSYLER